MDPFTTPALMILATFVREEIDERIGIDMLADIEQVRSDSQMEEMRESIVEVLHDEGYTDEDIDRIEGMTIQEIIGA